MNADRAEQAARLGVETSYVDWRGERHEAPEETVRAVLDVLDAPAEDPPREPVRCPTREELGRCWGWMVQLYAVRSRASGGMGDFGDLTALVRWSGEAGADFVLCNPLHAAAPVRPREPSPYYPSSRRFLDPLYLRVDGVPPLADPGALVDRDGLLQAKDAILRQRHAEPQPVVDPLDPALEDFATWCALAREHGPAYQDWPAELRHPRSPAVAAARDRLRDEVGYHAWLQRCCEEQLGAAQQAALDAGMRIGIVHDLAVGVNPGGADAWALQDDLARGMTVGAPPDAFNPAGQDWRQPPLRPDRLAASGFRAWREMLRAALRHGGGIRVDHALGLFRLWWIPDGASPAEGVYVRYPASGLLGVLAEETLRAGAIAIAEDLGTVPPGVSETLRAWGLFTSSVLWFAEDWPEQAFASVTTHDLEPATTYTGGDPIEVVARTPSRLFGVGIADAIGDPRRPNVPGTIDEHPNWRLPLQDAAGRPLLLDDLPGHPGVQRAVALLREVRPRTPGC